MKIAELLQGVRAGYGEAIVATVSRQLSWIQSIADFAGNYRGKGDGQAVGQNHLWIIAALKRVAVGGEVGGVGGCVVAGAEPVEAQLFRVLFTQHPALPNGHPLPDRPGAAVPLPEVV